MEGEDERGYDDDDDEEEEEEDASLGSQERENKKMERNMLQ